MSRKSPLVLPLPHFLLLFPYTRQARGDSGYRRRRQGLSFQQPVLVDGCHHRGCAVPPDHHRPGDPGGGATASKEGASFVGSCCWDGTRVCEIVCDLTHLPDVAAVCCVLCAKQAAVVAVTLPPSGLLKRSSQDSVVAARGRVAASVHFADDPGSPQAVSPEAVPRDKVQPQVRPAISMSQRPWGNHLSSVMMLALPSRTRGTLCSS